MSSGKRPAPGDGPAHEAWEQIGELARQHALVLHAVGGTMLLSTPEEQRRAGVRERVLKAHGMTEGNQE